MHARHVRGRVHVGGEEIERIVVRQCRAPVCLAWPFGRAVPDVTAHALAAVRTALRFYFHVCLTSRAIRQSPHTMLPLLGGVEFFPAGHQLVVFAVCFDRQVHVTGRHVSQRVVRMTQHVPVVQHGRGNDLLGIPPLRLDRVLLPPHPRAVLNHVARIGHGLYVRLQVRLVRHGRGVKHLVPPPVLGGRPNLRGHRERPVQVPLAQKVLALHVPGFIRVHRREKILTLELVHCFSPLTQVKVFCLTAAWRPV